MQFNGRREVPGARHLIWPLFQDPRALASLIPGCEALDQVDPNEFQGQIRVQLPAVAGVYQARVWLLEQEEPRSCRFAGEIRGPAGSIEGEAFFHLEEAQGRTTIFYGGQGKIGGMLARLSPRFVQGIVQALIDQGLDHLSLRAAEAVPVRLTGDQTTDG